MHTSTSITPSPKTLWAGRSISGVAVLFLLLDTLAHLAVPPPVADAFREIGFPLGLSVSLGVLEAILIVIYVLPPTAILGSILLTGYLGGAVAIHLRVEHPVFQMLFPVIVGVLIWGGVFVREAQLRALIPLRRRHDGETVRRDVTP